LPLCTACLPNIGAFDQPGGVDRLTAVKVYGDNLLLAGVEFDGVMVGSWPVPPDPAFKEARQTVVPLDQGAPPAQDEVTARNAFGSDADTLPITGPGMMPGPSFDVTPPGIEAYNTWYGLQEAVAVWVTGAGFYPGPATLANPDAGPGARTFPGGHAALGTKMRGEHALEVFFPRSMPSGTYQIDLTNDPIYAPAVPHRTPGSFVHN
jgi:hypothetical protein